MRMPIQNFDRCHSVNLTTHSRALKPDVSCEYVSFSTRWRGFRDTDIGNASEIKALSFLKWAPKYTQVLRLNLYKGWLIMAMYWIFNISALPPRSRGKVQRYDQCWMIDKLDLSIALRLGCDFCLWTLFLYDPYSNKVWLLHLDRVLWLENVGVGNALQLNHGYWHTSRRVGSYRMKLITVAGVVWHGLWF